MDVVFTDPHGCSSQHGCTSQDGCSSQVTTECVIPVLIALPQVMTWVSGKQQVASDEAYRDPTNLQAKLQKHQAFEAELTANKRRVDAATVVRTHTTTQRLITKWQSAAIIPIMLCDCVRHGVWILVVAISAPE